MFSLIIAIVAIALTVAIVAATMYHGGDTLSQGRDRASAAAVVTGAQQVAGAQVMHLALTGVELADVAGLVAAKDLSSAPAIAYTIDTAANTLSTVASSKEVCAAINASAGIKATVVDANEIAKFPYGCNNQTGADENKFTFKY